MRKLNAFLVAILLALVPAGTTAAQDEAGAILGRINSLRASRGLPGYTVNGALSAAAQQQAQWIVDTGSVSHTHPDGSGPRTRAVGAGYPSTDVSENIYGGTMATAEIAWSFWVNSGVHYAGIVHTRYSEVGVGIARGAWGAAYVTVFGNPGGPAYVPAAAPSGAGAPAASAGGGGAAAAPAPPSYIVGEDRHGNLMHEVQPGDTIGDIAMLYGYSWDDIPSMMELNAIEDVRDLDIGSIFLVPPRGGTHTPTPWDAGPTPTPAATRPPTLTPRASRTPVPSPTAWAPVTAAAPPALLVDNPATPTEAPVLLAQLPTKVKPPASAPLPATGVTIVRSGTSPWLVAALALQVGIVLAAGFEFVRRARRRK